MLEISKPFYYDHFVCTAENCEDSCCNMNWCISVDNATYQSYKNVQGDLGAKLKQFISKEPPYHIIKKDMNCSFLTQEGLCAIHAELGGDRLPETCKNYPRLATTYNDFFDLSLGISCPEVARIILNCKEPIQFIEEKYEDKEENIHIEPLVLETLRFARKFSIDIAQFRNLPLWQRAYCIIDIAVNVQEWSEKKIEVPYICTQHNTIRNGEFDKFISEIKDIELNQNLKLFQLGLLLRCAGQYSKVHKYFGEFIEKTIETICKDEFINNYAIIHKEFEEYHRNNMYIYENYLVYLLNMNYLIDLVGDEFNLVYEVSLMLAANGILKLSAEAMWYSNDKEMTLEDQVNIIHSFARVFEHGELLKNSIYQCMKENNIIGNRTLAALIS